jgi:hypothetical protein
MVAPPVMASASAARAEVGIVDKEVGELPGDAGVDGGGRQDDDDSVILKATEAIRNFIESN